MKYSVFTVIVLLLIACRSKVNGDMPLVALAPCDSLNTEIDAPTLIQYSDGFLFINGTYGDKGLVSVIDVDGDSLVCSFARKGQGRDEVLQIGSMDVFEKSGEKYMELFDNLQRKLFVYSIDNLIESKGEASPAYTRKADENLRLLEMYRLRNGSYLSTGRIPTKFLLLDDSLKIKKHTGEYLPDNMAEVDAMIRSKANYGRLYFSSDRKNVVSVVFMAGVLSLYSVENDSIDKKWDYTLHDLEYKVDGKAILPTRPMGYLAASMAGDKIIALYSGEMKENGTTYAKEFHLFDREGNLLKKYKVGSSLYNFCVDPSSQLVYAIAYEPETKILIYRMQLSETS